MTVTDHSFLILSNNVTVTVCYSLINTINVTVTGCYSLTMSIIMTIPFLSCDRYCLLLSDTKFIHVFGMKVSVTDKPKIQNRYSLTP